MTSRIPSDATLRSIWHRLSNRRSYGAEIRHKSLKCQKDHGSARVIIGVTGTGQKPCYRIVYTDAAGQEVIYGSWWDNHQPLENQTSINANWSTAVMTANEVDALMRETYGLKTG